MRLAMAEAKKGLGKVSPNPMVGCVIVKDNKVLSKGYHSEFGKEHAEVAAIKSAKEKINGARLYVTLEPCVMCAGASFWTQVGRIVYGATDEKRGFSKYSKDVLHPKTELKNGVMQNECEWILKEFFKKKR